VVGDLVLGVDDGIGVAGVVGVALGAVPISGLDGSHGSIQNIGEINPIVLKVAIATNR
jgi:hypothetical protein